MIKNGGNIAEGLFVWVQSLVPEGIGAGGSGGVVRVYYAVLNLLLGFLCK